MKAVRHCIIWSLIFFYIYIVSDTDESNWQKVLFVASLIISYIIVYYMLFFLIFPFLWGKKIYLIASIILNWLLFLSFLYLVYQKIIPFFYGESFGTVAIEVIANYSLLIYFTIIVIALSSYYSQKSLSSLKILNEKEKSLLVQELNFLKNQFNSHITFNFLNFCYSNIHKSSTNAAEAIELYSNMLRYSLKTKPEEKVLLVDEIRFIEEFIELQKLLHPKISIKFYYNGPIVNKFILPKILFEIVENATIKRKMGGSESPVKIDLMAYDRSLEFKVSSETCLKTSFAHKNEKYRQVLDGRFNSIEFSEEKNSLNTLIQEDGLKNVKEALALYYSNNYKFDITEDHYNYIYKLFINVSDIQ